MESLSDGCLSFANSQGAKKQSRDRGIIVGGDTQGDVIQVFEQEMRDQYRAPKEVATDLKCKERNPQRNMS